jgi:hypothetical protein
MDSAVEVDVAGREPALCELMGRDAAKAADAAATTAEAMCAWGRGACGVVATEGRGAADIPAIVAGTMVVTRAGTDTVDDEEDDVDEDRITGTTGNAAINAEAAGVVGRTTAGVRSLWLITEEGTDGAIWRVGVKGTPATEALPAPLLPEPGILSY